MKLFYIFPFVLLFGGTVFGQDLKKAKKVDKSNQESTESVDFDKNNTNKSSQSLIFPNDTNNEKQDEISSFKKNLSKEKSHILDDLKDSFDKINLKKENTDNWNQIEERYLAHILNELDDYPFNELKLSSQDADFRKWITEADDIQDIRLYARIIRQLNDSI